MFQCFLSFFYKVSECLHRIRLIKCGIVSIRKENIQNRNQSFFAKLRHISHHPNEKSSITLYLSIIESMNKPLSTHNPVLSSQCLYSSSNSLVCIFCMDSHFFKSHMSSLFYSCFDLWTTS